jgi:hypothetical protein
MAREQILRALDGKDLRTIRFTLCEEFTNPPEHLRPSGAQSIGFYVRLRDGQSGGWRSTDKRCRLHDHQ